MFPFFWTERRWVKYPTAVTSSETWCWADVVLEDFRITDTYYDLDTAVIVVAAQYKD